MGQIARNLIDYEDGFLKGMKYFVCDNDVLFTNEFKEILKNSGVELIRTRVATQNRTVMPNALSFQKPEKRMLG